MYIILHLLDIELCHTALYGINQYVTFIANIQMRNTPLFFKILFYFHKYFISKIAIHVIILYKKYHEIGKKGIL